jgi:hypothetical protein
MRSHRNGVGEDVVVLRAERRGLDEVDADTEDVLELDQETGQFEQGARWLDVDQEIDVALWTRVTAGNGSEEADVGRAVPRRRRQQSGAVPK